jgi:methyl-accepting chemotaxis protein
VPFYSRVFFPEGNPMFNRQRKAEIRHAFAESAAIGKSQAVIEFNLDGTIITANENFLKALGYTLAEIAGKHHRMFVDPAEQAKPEYAAFWAALNHGKYQAAEYKRIRKDGRAIWIQASYNPILGADGKPVSVIKFATDITAQKKQSMEDAGKIVAIARAQAVVEFEMDGTIITANQNFIDALGYSLAEIEGKHHSMFVEPAARDSTGYRNFWESLRRGEFQAAEYKRIGKGGKEVWILATYNPILDDSGKPFKIVKYATDVTRQKLIAAHSDGQLAAIRKSQAVIEFNMDGTIISANPNFLDTLGYTFAEIAGKHHRMFVDPADQAKPEYTAFWAALNRGEYQTAEYRRLGKGGKEVWIQASYNPILDLNQKPFKVVKYAADVTVRAIARMKAERARGLIDSVAAGAEEMSASIREISETMVRSRENAVTAAGRVESADIQAQKLNAAAQAMGGIVGMIGDITGQINLLALNATIESARAGEAGRGFAVVAAEVKNLANQAKQATDKISDEIEALNGISSEVVDSLAAIKTAIDHVNEFVSSTAAAVEEQSIVTADMSTNMQRAAAELA